MRASNAIWLSILLTVLPAGALAQTDQRQDDPPGLDLLHPEARKGLPRQLGLTGLSQLTRYEIDLAIDDRSASFAGKLVLTYTNLTGAALPGLPLRLQANAPTEHGAPAARSGALELLSVAAQAGPGVTFKTTRPTLVQLQFARPLEPGERVQLVMRYKGSLRRLPANVNDPLATAMASMRRIGKSEPGDFGLLGVGDGLLTMANAYPALAPFREGAFDTAAPGKVGDVAYNQVAAFRVRTIAPAGLELVTNLIDRRRTPGPGSTQVTLSEGAAVREFVLVAGRGLTSSTVKAGRTTVTSYYLERDAVGGKAALETAAAALVSLEKRFGPYPYTELDVVESSLTGGAGGVEFSSLVLIAGMLYRPPSASNSPLAMLLKMWGNLGRQLQGLGPEQPKDGKAPAAAADNPLASQMAFTVMHEVAHQYFAILVGNDSKRHPALDEPLCQYAAGLCYGDRYGAAARNKAMDANAKLNYALYRMLDGRDGPALRPTSDFNNSLEYAALVYGKAPYLYVALENKHGAERLHRALAAAVRKYRFRIATLDSWRTTLERSLGGPSSGVTVAFKRWLSGSHGDADLGVDDSGRFVMQAMFGEQQARQLEQSLKMLGIKPKTLLRSMFGGGGLGSGAPRGKGIDVDKALRALEGLGGK